MATSWYTEADFPDERNGLSISGVTADTLAMVRNDMVSELVGLVAAILLNYVFKYAFRISVSLYVAWRDFLILQLIEQISIIWKTKN